MVKIEWENVILNEEADDAAVDDNLLLIWKARSSGVHLAKSQFFSDVMGKYEAKRKEDSRASLSKNQRYYLLVMARDYYKAQKMLIEATRLFPENEADLKAIRASLICKGSISKAQRNKVQNMLDEYAIAEELEKSECKLIDLD